MAEDGDAADRTEAELRSASTSELVAYLSQPSTYGLESGVVEAKETHMSWVFLTPRRVYKFKKSVTASFLDYATLARREHFCREELRLNKRLAASVYVRVVPVTRRTDGALSLNGEGIPVEWLVEMRRLPPALMLDRAIVGADFSFIDIEPALDLLFEFFSKAPPVDMDEDRYLSILAAQQQENREIFARCRGEQSAAELALLADPVTRVIDSKPQWLLEPLESRRIIEGHGDLRPEHICLTRPPAIIDCLEFSRELRLVDPFDELSYLALECRLLGAAKIGTDLIAHYAKRAASRPSQRLLDFYAAYRAAVRARLALGHIADERRGQTGRWVAKARAYAKAAAPAAIRLQA